ncbi:MAG: hypothetical protein EB127_21495, partial [Alphaproteobacteria bacterium]|nr:hypothetical protein [Alphaproteobacteria bacterium]
KGDKLPKAVDHVGKFLQKINYENALVAIRSQIQLERIIKFNLDENPEWGSIITKITKKVSGN